MGITSTFRERITFPQMPRKPAVEPKDPERPSAQFGRRYAKEIYTDEEVKALLARTASSAPSAVRNYALICVLWQAGLRITETLKLSIEDFDLERAQIHVRHAKGGKTRRVVAGPRAVEATRRWIAKRAELGLDPHAPLFCTLQGTYMHTAYVRKTMNRLAHGAKTTKRVHPHGFRATFASNLARQGVPPVMIQRQLGHESLATTSVYLAAISTEDVEEAMSKVSWG